MDGILIDRSNLSSKSGPARHPSIYPDHSIGINYGRTDPGWLLSPQYENNEQLFEIRYRWLKSRQLAIDIRGRWREDLEELATGRKRDEFDFYLRFTWGFTARHF